MDNTIGISLAGYSFQAEPAAYQRLRAYLDELIATFGTSPEGRDVVSSIEERLAELLTLRLEDARPVMLGDVEVVIAQIGDADQMADERPPIPDEEPRPRRRARFYRDTEHRMLGGVCSGIALRLGIPAWVLRMLFLGAVLLLGSGLLLYLVLWLALPAAITPRERMEMRGQPISFSGLRDEVWAQYQSVRNAYRDGKTSSRKGGISTLVERLLMLFATVLLWFARLVLYAVGVCLLVGSILGVLACILGTTLYIMASGSWAHILHTEMGWFGNVIGYPNLFLLLIVLIAIIPLGFMFVAGMSLVARVRFRLMPCLLIFALWLMAGGGLVVWLIGGFASIDTPVAHHHTVQRLEVQAGDTLQIRVKGSYRASMPRFHCAFGGWNDELFDAGEWMAPIAQHQAHVVLHPTDSAHAMVQVVARAMGRNERQAHANVLDIAYQPTAEGRTLILPSHFSMHKMSTPLGLEQVEVHIYLPEGIHLTVDESTVYLFRRMLRRQGSLPVADLKECLRVSDGYIESADGTQLMLLRQEEDTDRE